MLKKLKFYRAKLDGNVTSVPMVVLFSQILGLSYMFPTIYISFLLVGFIVNIIMVKIPPISRKPDQYLQPGVIGDSDEMGTAGNGFLKSAVLAAIKHNERKKTNLNLFSGLKLTGNIWFTLEPIILVLGAAVMVIAIPVFGWLTRLRLFLMPWVYQKLLPQHLLW